MSDVSLIWIEQTARLRWRWNVVICGKTYARCETETQAKRIMKALKAVEPTQSDAATERKP